MKLKEVLPSLWRIYQLKKINVGALQEPQAHDLPVTVCLTAIPSRLKAVAITVRSVLAQTRLPERVELWLHSGLQNQLPLCLSSLQGQRFHVRYTDLDSPHCKLVPALLADPQRVIVTCDDDLLYPENWLETLYAEHLQAPQAVVCTTARRISASASGELLSYRNWPHQYCGGGVGANLLPLGSGGVLYPVDSLHPEVTATETYLRLCPKADDLWFKIMAVRAGTSSRLIEKCLSSPLPIPNTQRISLKRSNVDGDYNRDQMQALIRHFELSDGDLGLSLPYS